VEDVAAAVFARCGGGPEVSERSAWLDLRARAAHMREDPSAAIIWWNEAIALAEAATEPAPAINWAVLQLRLVWPAVAFWPTGGGRRRKFMGRF